MSSHTWIATVVLIAVSAPFGATRADAVETDLERALALFDALDAVTIGLSCDEAPIEKVLDRVAEATNVPIRADWPALDRLGVARFEPITLDLESVPASTVLAAIALQLGDDYDRPMFEAHGGHLIMTSVDATREMAFTDAYDVRDLLANDAAVDKLRAEAPPIPVPLSVVDDAPVEDDGKGVSPDDGGGGGRGGRGGDAGGRRGLEPLPAIEVDETDLVPLSPGEDLMELIAEHVEPEAWIEYGGSRASVRERQGVLLVTAPASLHRKLHGVLARLRRMNPSELLIDAAIVDVPRDVYGRLVRRHSAKGAAFAQALLADAQATVRWRAASVVALGSELEQSSENADTSVRLVLRPRRTDAGGAIELSVEAWFVGGDDQRSARSVIDVPTRTGGAAIELPAAQATGDLRMLVVVPVRR